MTHEKRKCWSKEYVQPAGMFIASSLNLFGAAISLMISDKDRTTPLFYTAMCTSAIYMASNATKIYQIRQQNVLSFEEKELARRDVQRELTEIIIEL